MNLSRKQFVLISIALGASLGPLGNAAPLRGEDPAEPPSLEQQLLQEDPADLARQAREHGDPQRGSLLFHQPRLTCTNCHTVGTEDSPLAPDLTRLEGDVSDARLVESLLTPSKTIREGYEPLVILLEDGRTLTGLLDEDRDDALLIHDAAEPGKLRTIPKSEIDEQIIGNESIMPSGLVNLTGGRRQFLDLIAYLIAIVEGGPQRAHELAPPPSAPQTARPVPQVYRTIMPHSGPASLAVGLGNGIWLCFDPQRGGVNYVWQGDLDLAPTLAQKINDPARIKGRLFFRDNQPGPLRPHDPDHPPDVSFRGYRFDQGTVEVRYELDGLPVRERFLPLPGDSPGLVRELQFSGNLERLWIFSDEQTESQLEIESATRDNGAWRIDSEGSAPFTVRITLRAQPETEENP